MPTTRLTMTNEVGLHARPAAQFAKAAAGFVCDVRLHTGGAEANAKSLLSILALGIEPGQWFDLVTAGEDEDEATAALTALVDEL